MNPPCLEPNIILSEPLNSSAKVFEFLRNRVLADVEEFWVLALDPQKRLIQHKMLFRGTVDACLVHPRDIFRFACRENASSLVVTHNHPSRDTRPSFADLEITDRIFRIGELFEIPLLDHIITAGDDYQSFADEGWGCFR